MNTYVWGCGKYIQEKLNYELLSLLAIDGFIDVSRRGKLYGKEICAPNELRDVKRIIIGSIKYCDEIKRQILSLGIDVEIIFIDDALVELLNEVTRSVISSIIEEGKHSSHKIKVIPYGSVPWKISIHKKKLDKYFEYVECRNLPSEMIGNKTKVLTFSIEETLDLSLKYGIKNIICAELFLIQMEKMYIEKLDIKADRKYGTSVADSKSYPLFCYAAAKDENVFRNFRNSYIYLDTVGAASREFGEKALEFIQGRYPSFSEREWKLFLLNDNIGSPYTYSFNVDSLKVLADPNTFAYIMQLQELFVEFGELFRDGIIRSVCEIGVGYGGLCRLIFEYFGVDSYVLVDLPEVLELSKKYLSNYIPINNVYGVDGTKDFKPIQVDLLISNYAFSELGREAQEKYMKNVVLNANHGIMIWNRCSEYDMELGGMTLEEFINSVNNAKVWSNSLIGETTKYISWSKSI